MQRNDRTVGNMLSNPDPDCHTLRLRSREWFDVPDDPSTSAIHIERYTNFGISTKELRSGKPIIGIAQTGSDLVPCTLLFWDHPRAQKVAQSTAFYL